MGRTEREKGARFERLVAKAFGTERVGTRGKQDAEHADVVHEAYFIQCRHYKKIRVCRWYEETKARAEAVNKVPLVVLKEDRGEVLVLLSLRNFLKLTEGDGEDHGQV